MTTLSFSLRCDRGELRDYFIELLEGIGFYVIHREEWDDGFFVIGASAKRSSQLTATLMGLFTGYIRRNRIAIELVANRERDHLAVTLKCTPYMDVVDLAAPDEDPRERERCERTAGNFYDRIRERFGDSPEDNG